MPTSAPVERLDDGVWIGDGLEDSEGESEPVEAVAAVAEANGVGVWAALAEEVENKERSLCWFITVIGWPHSVPGPTDALAVATDPDRLRTDVELS